MQFRKILGDLLAKDGQIYQPYFWPDETAVVQQFKVEETYFQLQLSRMFLRHSRKLFRNQYPVVHGLFRFAGLQETVEVNQLLTPIAPGQQGAEQLERIIVLKQDLLGPVIYRGDSLELLLGLYAAPAIDWAERFLSLAQGISALTLQSTLTTALAVAAPLKQAIDDLLDSDGLSLKTGLNTTLKKEGWFRPGYLAVIAAPDQDVAAEQLAVQDEALVYKGNGRPYQEHDYMLIAIRGSYHREDWQRLGYGAMWRELLNSAAMEDDKERVRDKYLQFSGAILGSQELTWRDRQTIIKLAQERVTRIRELRTGQLLENVRSSKGQSKMDALAQVSSGEFERARPAQRQSAAEMLATDWF